MRENGWDVLIEELYSPEEKEKLEWAIGACIFGESKVSTRYIIIHGPMQSGKSTTLRVIEKLLVGTKDVGHPWAEAIEHHRFVFETLNAISVSIHPQPEKQEIHIRTIGCLVSPDQHDFLMDMVEAYQEDIRKKCLNTYTKIESGSYERRLSGGG